MQDLLRMESITKVYPNGVVANRDVTFAVKPGEIHALVGENGAGKTTLMKILFGLEQPDAGSIVYEGRHVRIPSPHAAIAMGIGMVHQHFMLAPSLTVAENVVLGAEPRRGPFLDVQAAVERTEQLAKKYNLPVDPRARIRDIPVGMRQKVEILKTLYRGARLLVLDEPTAVLTPQETVELFAALENLKAHGHTIIFISHKLREVKQISNRVTVMRRGQVVGVARTAEVTEADISRMMVGRDVVLRIEKPPANPTRPVLQVKDVRYRSELGKEVLRGVTFSVRAGEIVGVAGVEGNGQLELAEILTGLRTAHGGTVIIDGVDATNAPPHRLRAMGVSHIPEDRMTHGVAAKATVEENLISDRFHRPRFQRFGVLRRKAIRDHSLELIRQYDIRTPGPTAAVSSLSGGNIQKVIVAREFSSEPKLIIANQPTRGVDVGAAEFIHRQLVDAARAGAAVLLISADLNEVMALSDRLLVLYNGEIVASFAHADQVSEEELGLYMLGLKRQAPSEAVAV